MSRTTLCVLTAGLLAAGSIGLMVARYAVLGPEVKLPMGPATWKITLVAQGERQGDARLTMLAPLDVGRQHVLNESFASTQLSARAPDAKRPARRRVVWTPRAGTTNGPLRLRAEFLVALESTRANALMGHAAGSVAAAPRPGEYLEAPTPSPNAPRLTEQARQLTEGLENATDVAEALFHFVDREIANEPSTDRPPVGAVDCLVEGSGDSGAKARLLTALLRDRGLPARVVTGLALTRGPEQRGHYWVEAWVHDRWLPLCPTRHHFGRVPSTYLVLAYGDLPVLRASHVNDLNYAFLVEKLPAVKPVDADASTWRRGFEAASLFLLPPGERRLVEFLLLLPVAALIICIFRNVIGLSSFGTFAPALVGLAFRELNSLPGMLVFVGILLIGWLLRRALGPYHLLQVPRVALMLSLITTTLVAIIVAAHHFGAEATTYVALFPMVILTGMVERFWTLEAEDGTAASFRTLLQTLVIATAVALVAGLHAVVRHLFRYPETLGLVMAAQLLIGRYTGYRLMELWRFRDLMYESVAPAPSVLVQESWGGDAGTTLQAEAEARGSAIRG